MTHPNRRASEAEVEARRRQVAAALLAGADNFTVIARELGVSHQTIGRDVRAIEEQWQAAAVKDIATAKGRMIGRIQRAVAALWPKVRAGDERAIGQLVNLLNLEAKLLGLNAPDRIEDNRTVTIHLLAESMAEQSGLDKDEVLAEAQRILAEANR